MTVAPVRPGVAYADTGEQGGGSELRQWQQRAAMLARDTDLSLGERGFVGKLTAGLKVAL